MSAYTITFRLARGDAEDDRTRLPFEWCREDGWLASRSLRKPGRYNVFLQASSAAEARAIARKTYRGDIVGVRRERQDRGTARRRRNSKARMSVATTFGIQKTVWRFAT